LAAVPQGLKPVSICDAYAALKRRSSTVGRLFGTTKVVPFPVMPSRKHRQGGRKINDKIKINVKSSGQECPLHTCNVKGKRAGAPAPHMTS
jgi:hypothetical protein